MEFRKMRRIKQQLSNDETIEIDKEKKSRYCGYDFYAALHQIGYTGPVAQTQNKSKSSNSQNKIVHKNSDLAVKGKDLNIENTDIYDNILTYSFPCQD